MKQLFSSVQSLSRVWLFATPWTAARQASLPIINSQSLLKLTSIESVNHPTISSPVIPIHQLKNKLKINKDIDPVERGASFAE